MQKTGGRLIKKAFLIDQRSIRFLTREEVQALKQIDILKEYLESHEKEFSQTDTGRPGFTGRNLTNLGTFRIYAQNYLTLHQDIRGDMLLFVRELVPNNSGVPLEIYCFSKEVVWTPYEQVQSRITEHLLAVLPKFGLRVFQRSSDIYRENDNQVDVDGLKNPVSPDNGDSAGERS